MHLLNHHRAEMGAYIAIESTFLYILGARGSKKYDAVRNSGARIVCVCVPRGIVE